MKAVKRIAIDMDGVLADTFDQFARYHELETGIRRSRTDVLGVDENKAFEKARVWLHQPGFFRHQRVIDDAQRVVKALNEAYDLFIVSAAMEFPLSLPEKYAWLEEHFPFIGWRQIVFCGSKTVIRADIMIDDHFKNLDHFEGQTLLFNQPHNHLADPGRHQRVFGWREIEALLLPA